MSAPSAGHVGGVSDRARRGSGATGPVEWVAIVFDGEGVDPAVVPALAGLVDAGTIAILDLLIVAKDADGAVSAVELGELDAEQLAAFDALDGDVLGLLSEQDVPIVGEEVPPGSTALVVLWENVWAAAFAQTVRAAGGVLLTHDRIPADIVEQAMAAAATDAGVQV
ncbi:DUF6325 family protein [Pseudonocardia sp.]|uniref:DUF6325 family protein n=1 Tax=Pseudonocardia sp. TaxID=60912 RepID=UPI00262F4B90|nr:DUF6325 family protein [Pseudonocardia sp.]